MNDRGAVGVFGSVVLVSMVVAAGGLAFVSLQPDGDTQRVGVRDGWVPVNVSGSGERWDGHVYQVEGVVGQADRVEAVLVHNGTSYSVDLEAGVEVWLPCPSTEHPASSVSIDGERASWWANLPCHARVPGGAGGASSPSVGDQTETEGEVGDCERKVWVGGDEVASGPCVLE